MHWRILLKPKPTNHVYRGSWTSHENRALSEGEGVRIAQFKNATYTRAGKMNQQLRALTLAEPMSLAPNIYMVADNHS